MYSAASARTCPADVVDVRVNVVWHVEVDDTNKAWGERGAGGGMAATTVAYSPEYPCMQHGMKVGQWTTGSKKKLHHLQRLQGRWHSAVNSIHFINYCAFLDSPDRYGTLRDGLNHSKKTKKEELA